MKLLVTLFALVALTNAISYVRIGGDDANFCTNPTSDACETVAEGLSAAEAGDGVLDIGAGRFAMSSPLVTTIVYNITGVDSDTTELDFSAVDDATAVAMTTLSVDSYLGGLSILNANNSLASTASAVNFVVNTGSLTIRDVWIQDALTAPTSVDDSIPTVYAEAADGALDIDGLYCTRCPNGRFNILAYPDSDSRVHDVILEDVNHDDPSENSEPVLYLEVSPGNGEHLDIDGIVLRHVAANTGLSILKDDGPISMSNVNLDDVSTEYAMRVEANDNVDMDLVTLAFGANSDAALRLTGSGANFTLTNVIVQEVDTPTAVDVINSNVITGEGVSLISNSGVGVMVDASSTFTTTDADALVNRNGGDNVACASSTGCLDCTECGSGGFCGIIGMEAGVLAEASGNGCICNDGFEGVDCGTAIGTDDGSGSSLVASAALTVALLALTALLQ